MFLKIAILLLVSFCCVPALMVSGERLKKMQDNGKEQHEPRPFQFKYNIDDKYHGRQWRHETQDSQGRVKGGYGYMNKHGVYRRVYYVADKGGFRVRMRTNEPGTEKRNPAHVRLNAEPFKTTRAPLYIHIQEDQHKLKSHHQEEPARLKGHFHETQDKQNIHFHETQDEENDDFHETHDGQNTNFQDSHDGQNGNFHDSHDGQKGSFQKTLTGKEVHYQRPRAEQNDDSDDTRSGKKYHVRTESQTGHGGHVQEVQRHNNRVYVQEVDHTPQIYIEEVYPGQQVYLQQVQPGHQVYIQEVDPSSHETGQDVKPEHHVYIHDSGHLDQEDEEVVQPEHHVYIQEMQPPREVHKAQSRQEVYVQEVQPVQEIYIQTVHSGQQAHASSGRSR